MLVGVATRGDIIMRLTVLSASSWLPSVGLEIHAQITSQTKIFSQSIAKSSGTTPNSTVSLFDVAVPGTMPIINACCVKAGIRTALSLGAKINTRSFFDRKHYFYPDLPASYQISQHRVPLAQGGCITIPLRNSSLIVNLKQIHLEHDSGKIVFGERGEKERDTLIDYNRAGIGLMEIVTDPVMINGEQAACFVHELRLLLKKIGACDGDMQNGSLRIDANVSVRPSHSHQLGVRTEVKNVNGVKHLRKVIDYEISRHIKILNDGGTVLEETRSFDERQKVTTPTRGKSCYEDYRFMAEHDLPPLILYTDSSPPPSPPPHCSNGAINIDDVARGLPELPLDLRARLVKSYGISSEHVQVLENEDWAVEYFEEVVKIANTVPVKLIYSWITSELYGISGNRQVSSQQLASLLILLHQRMITGPVAKQILKVMAKGDAQLAQLIHDKMNVKEISDTELYNICTIVLKEYCQLVEQYHNGKKKRSLSSLIGEAMKLSEGKCNPVTVRAMLLKELEDH